MCNSEEVMTFLEQFYDADIPRSPSLLPAWRQQCREHDLNSCGALLQRIAVSGPALQRTLGPVMDGGSERLRLEALAAALSQRILQIPSSSASSSTSLPCHTLADLRLQQSSPVLYATGCASLDGILRGGFRAGWVWEVFGEAGTGKTQLALQCLLMQLAWHLAATAFRTLSGSDETPPPFPTGSPCCLYLVSEDVPAARLAPIAGGCVERVLEAYSRHCRQLPPDWTAVVMPSLRRALTVRKVLSLLKIRPTASLECLQALLHSGQLGATVLLNHRKNPSPDALTEGDGVGGVLVIDSIAAAAIHTAASRDDRTILKGSDSQAALLQDIGRALRDLACHWQLTVLVVNQVRGVPSSARRETLPSRRYPLRDVERLWVPALGQSWGWVPQGRLYLSRLPHTSAAPSFGLRENRRLAVMVGSAYHPPRTAVFSIQEEGLVAI